MAHYQCKLCSFTTPNRWGIAHHYRVEHPKKLRRNITNGSAPTIAQLSAQLAHALLDAKFGLQGISVADRRTLKELRLMIYSATEDEPETTTLVNEAPMREHSIA